MKFIAFIALLFLATTGHGQYDEIIAKKIFQAPKFTDTAQANSLGARKAGNFIRLMNSDKLAYRNRLNNKWIVIEPNGNIDSISGLYDIEEGAWLRHTPESPRSFSDLAYFDGYQVRQVVREALDTSKSSNFFGTGGGVPAGADGNIQFKNGNFFNGSGNLTWDDANNRMGIGTNVPSSILTVLGNTDDAAIGPILAKSTTGSNIGVALSLDATGNTGGHSYSFISTGLTAGTGVGYFGVFDGTTGDYRMVISPSGNVGIGTVVPSTKLEVNGAITYKSMATAPTVAVGNCALWVQDGVMKKTCNINGDIQTIIFP